MQDYDNFKEWFTSKKNPNLPDDITEEKFEVYVNNAITSEEGYKTYIEELFKDAFTSDKQKKKLNSELIAFIGNKHNDVYDTSNLDNLRARSDSPIHRTRIIRDTRNGIYDILH